MQRTASWRPRQQRLRQPLVMVFISLVLVSVLISGLSILPRWSISDTDTAPVRFNLLPAVEAAGPTPAGQPGPYLSGEALSLAGVSIPLIAQSEKDEAISPLTESEDLVAVINGRSVDGSMLRTQMRADRAMALLTGESLQEEPAEMITRLINSELVWQEAKNPAPTTDVVFSLSALLESYGKSEVELDAVLSEAGMSRHAFDTYFARLLTIDRHAVAQANVRNLSPAQYLEHLQARAQDQLWTAGQFGECRDRLPRVPNRRQHGGDGSGRDCSVERI